MIKLIILLFVFETACSIPPGRIQYNYELECGKSDVLNGGYINYDSVEGEFPWTVLIYKKGFSYPSCTGTIIHKKVILTSASCINGIDDIEIKVGKWKLGHENRPLQSIVVTKVLKHHNFTLTSQKYDFALLVLNTAIELNFYWMTINEICLLEKFNQISNYGCYIVGWENYNCSGNCVMKKIPTTISPGEGCRNESDDSFLCATKNNDFNICNLIDGAPILCQINSNFPNYRFIQVGIFNNVYNCQNFKTQPQTIITTGKQWIDQQMHNLRFEKSVYTL